MKVEIGPYPKDGEKRIKKVRIHKQDLWSLDHTLALIIYPAMVKFKKNEIDKGYGFPCSLTEHVGEMTKKQEKTCRKEWLGILDEIIWTFERIVKDDDHEAYFIKTKAGKNAWDKKKDKMAKNGDWLGSLAYIGKFSKKKHDAHYKRCRDGMQLFAKYYHALWD
jgi:hypothetical protein